MGWLVRVGFCGVAIKGWVLQVGNDVYGVGCGISGCFMWVTHEFFVWCWVVMLETCFLVLLVLF